MFCWVPVTRLGVPSCASFYGSLPIQNCFSPTPSLLLRTCLRLLPLHLNFSTRQLTPLSYHFRIFTPANLPSTLSSLPSFLLLLLVACALCIRLCVTMPKRKATGPPKPPASGKKTRTAEAVTRSVTMPSLSTKLPGRAKTSKRSSKAESSRHAGFTLGLTMRTSH